MLKFLQSVIEDPDDYVDYWNLEEEEGVTAAMIKEIALDLSRRTQETLANPPDPTRKAGVGWLNDIFRHLYPLFTRYIGIDYSGARTPITSLKGLRVYLAG